MPALIHWLHLSAADVTKARRIIDAFREDDTVDALGFQPISERFDNWFYPAVTTPMTRARYYVFVPAIYAHLERQRPGYRAFLDRSVALQHELRRRLLKMEKTKHGVIRLSTVSDDALVFQCAYRDAHQSVQFIKRSLVEACTRIGTWVLLIPEHFL